MADTPSDLFIAIGRLTEAVQGLRREVDTLNRQVESKLDNIPPQLDKIAARVDHLEKNFAELKTEISTEVMPIVNEVRHWKQRGIGALSVAGMGGGAIGLILSNFGSSLWSLWQGMGRH